VKVTKDDSTSAISGETAVVIREEGSHQVIANEDEGLEIKAARAGDAVNDFAGAAVDQAINVVKSKTKEFYNSGVFDPGFAAARKDSAEIARLGPLVTHLATEFECMETMVCGHTYPEQVQLLTGFKKLLEEQINVINSRRRLVNRL